ncbi:hypothetical protein PVAND_010141 [Polypedilum vanderplanki]|uniref:ABC transporter domain-containing protein n=1 Tax=Polypedilum vanderplanki TaxID=319348 RepID=A0A9J6CFG1_POLVA|nr:hypothetical protein PVAND_010141 [Polypedilum vanderplanki]
MNSVEVRNVHKSYGNKKDKRAVLNGLNLSVAHSSIYALIGASGCGKTTLLSCILGMKELDSGTIKVLRHKVNHDKTSKVGHLIGFMPQNSALIGELTIRETLNYFGSIFLMSKKNLEERSQMIKELLELPPDDRLIENLSGGQRRRVSLAAAIIHNPQILILDEPTVGVDSILRDKIWKFLIKSTRKSNLSIIITTHYISEAQQSDRCGMMRDGILLAEDAPKNILTKYNAKDLDEAFLNLCLLKQKVPDEFECITDTAELIIDEKPLDNEIESKCDSLLPFEKRKKFNLQTIDALSKKEYIRMKRQYAEVFFILILPILQILGLAYAIGGLPKGLKIGIINNEVLNSSICNQYLNFNDSYLNENYECIFNHVSCHLLNEINDKDITKVYYDDFEKAFLDAKKGNIIGVLTINQNISNILTKMFKDGNLKITESLIGISLDQSDLQLTTFMQSKLYQAYERFNKKLMKSCEFSEKLLSIPMNFETFYASIDSDFKTTIFPAVILQIIMFSSMGYTCFAIAQSRIDGVWNRTLLAGVRPIEILFTQIFVCFFVIIISLVEIGITSYFTLDVPIRGSLILLTIFGILACFTGSITGIAMSVLTDNLHAISIISLAIVQGTSTLSGGYWPLEAQPTLLKYISLALPVTIPSFSVRNIAVRGLGLEDPIVQYGFVVCIIWIAFSLIFAYYAINKRRFSSK